MGLIVLSFRPIHLETFLRGMETYSGLLTQVVVVSLETFLRGMETKRIKVRNCLNCALKPSLEGWKPNTGTEPWGQDVP